MKEQKRFQRYLFVLLLLACLGAEFRSKDQKSLVHAVFGTVSADFVTNVQEIQSSANRWKPGEEPIPIDVAVFSERAKQHVLQRHPELSTVTFISMEIAPFAVETLASKDVPAGPSKIQNVAWYIVFIFSVWLPNGEQLDIDERTVGMMLDGTILEMVKKKGP